MNTMYEAALRTLAFVNGLGHWLPAAAWDLGSFLQNAKSQVQLWGGLLLMLMGVVGLIWGGVMLIRKLISGPQGGGQQHGWGSIALLILVGGALGTGGWQLISQVGSGGQQTIEDLGGGTVIMQSAANLVGLVNVLTGGLLG